MAWPIVLELFLFAVLLSSFELRAEESAMLRYTPQTDLSRPLLRRGTRPRTTRSVDYVGTYEPLASGFNYEKLGVVPKLPAAYK